MARATGTSADDVVSVLAEAEDKGSSESTAAVCISRILRWCGSYGESSPASRRRMHEVFNHNLARLVECADWISAAGAPVELVVTLAVPCDEVAFAVFHEVSAQTVAQVCDLAGIPAQRLSPAVDAHFPVAEP